MSSHSIIRDATHDDCPQICQLWNGFIRSTVVTFNNKEHTVDSVVRDIEEKQRNGYPFLVATLADKVIGFATYRQFRGGPGYAHTMESTIMISTEAQSGGTGRRLMVRLEDHAHRNGVHSIFAGVSAENSGAVTFHEKCGYTRISRLREVGFKFGRWHDLILLQKIID